MFTPAQEPMDLEQVHEIVADQAGVIGKHKKALIEIFSEIKSIGKSAWIRSMGALRHRPLLGVWVWFIWAMASLISN